MNLLRITKGMCLHESLLKINIFLNTFQFREGLNQGKFT